MGHLVVIILVFILAAILAVLAVTHFMERGFLLNNAYIYASEEERKAMDKKPYYRQSAIAFSLLSVGFLLIGLSLVLHNSRIVLIEIPLALVVFGVVSLRRHNQQK